MAKIKAETADLDKLISGMTTLSTTIDDIADEILDSCAGQLESAYRNAIQSAANRGYSTGSAAANVKCDPAKKNAYGHFIAAHTGGTDADGTSNVLKVCMLEYGTWRQAAHPVVSQAVASVQGSLEEQAKSALEAKVGDLCGE